MNSMATENICSPGTMSYTLMMLGWLSLAAANLAIDLITPNLVHGGNYGAL